MIKIVLIMLGIVLSILALIGLATWVIVAVDWVKRLRGYPE